MIIVVSMLVVWLASPHPTCCCLVAVLNDSSMTGARMLSRLQEPSIAQKLAIALLQAGLGLLLVEVRFEHQAVLWRGGCLINADPIVVNHLVSRPNLLAQEESANNPQFFGFHQR